MAPRRRTATPSAGAQAASLASLPDALLERILGLLGQADRHRAALVSQRWHAAAHAPGSLRLVRLTSFDNSVARLQSLAAWLQRHGQHVQEVSLDLYPPYQAAQPCTWELAGCLTACAAAAAGSLRQLYLQMYVSGATLCVASWCAALRHLRSLTLNVSTRQTLHISSSLGGLTAVTHLALRAEAVVVDAAVQLPPNVEQLRLSDRKSAALPHQLSALTRLSSLALHDMPCPPGGFAVLTSLGQLARLAMSGNSHLPACLSQLISLEELCLDETSSSLGPDEVVAALNEALRQLTGLTSLCILDERCQPPAALAGLSRLQRCCLGSAKFDPAELPGPPTPLPPGPWAASLRELGASLDVLHQSTGVLSAATQLTRLALTGGNLQPDSDALWEWARSHRSLQHLQIDAVEDTPLTAGTLWHICDLRNERPGLKVVTELVDFGGGFDDQFGIFD